MKKFLYIFGIGGIVLFLFFVFTNIWILQNKKNILSSEEFTGREIALVFGGGMKNKTTQSDMQEDRVQLAVELYKQGKIQQMILTGDDGANRFDEVTYMKKYALDNGVSEEDISIDPHGYNTYTSCYRASHERKIKEMVAISQEFHLSRILFFCNHFGIDTLGVSADLEEYDTRGKIWTMTMREMLARFKGFVQVYITKPEPLMFYK
ncbi:MAG: ElyC/SanA/YdcF family protein [Candidatus Magasanikbacteria bacterium]